MSAPFKKLRAECAKRAGGYCEADCGKWIGEDGSLAHADHFFGRGAGRNSETLETVWLLCPEDDLHKTENRPSASYWLGKYVLHCQRHGYAAEAERAEARLDFVKARAS